MSQLIARNLDYDRPIELAPGVYWVGFADPQRGLYCNPYLIVDGDEGVLIDGGSRPEFSVVAMKILQTGLEPGRIGTLIYQHYDPDLCGSVANLEALIDRSDLRIVSKHENNVFIRYYGVRAALSCIDEMEHRLVLASGRTLRFIPTPYAHTAGSFMTYDEQSGILFTSDLLGAFDPPQQRDLFTQLDDACLQCNAELPPMAQRCAKTGALCTLSQIVEFHRIEMPSNRALRMACAKVAAVGARLVAPQHGSVWQRQADVDCILRRLNALENVGIDGVPAQ